ncbi:MFS transporter, UMF1 family [Chitinophaga costaii]|uniref:MFS transporter, UMF1 family n=1 Tax=Chitinophaga costaii TaxID=1335309 RepID=A0A1C4F399_9BACT|nr:MFS transporter [Chitinophaga costaii]PUZ22106.1 MFS transporter [Chitinophaga costaii]SCC50324.1 MFS transporter, UMF1 family [Chitinophaga costaii]
MQITAPKKVLNGWAMYDWANSVFNLVITTTFFPIYFTKATPADITLFGTRFHNSVLYDYTAALAFLIVAALSPILSSIADTRGNKKKFLRFFTLLGSIFCSALYFFKSSVFGSGESMAVYGLGCFLLSTIGYCGGLVFYNSYLPEIAAPEDRDRVSAKGFSMGYIGSVLLQLIGFALVVLHAQLGLDEVQPLLITFLLVGVWWFGFAQITFSVLPASKAAAHVHKGNVWKDGFTELKKVGQQVKYLPVLKRFLSGFFFYSMGVQTVMLAATFFGDQVLHLSATKLIVTVVIIQLVAILGAWIMSVLSGKIGNLRVIIIVVLIWIGICIAGYYMQTATDFYILASVVGLVMGGIQSLSRSTYSKLMPETEDTASFFSFYDVTEKLSIVIGMFSFGFIHQLTHSMRFSVLALAVFFIIGLACTIFALQKQKQLAA